MEDNTSRAAGAPFDAGHTEPAALGDNDVWRDLVERAHHLALCVFKGSTKADFERARHNAAVLANAIDHARQAETLAGANKKESRADARAGAVAQAQPERVATPIDQGQGERGNAIVEYAVVTEITAAVYAAQKRWPSMISDDLAGGIASMVRLAACRTLDKAIARAALNRSTEER